LTVFLFLSFWPISYSQLDFFASPVSSSAQPRIRPTDPISFGHLQPPDVSYRTAAVRCVICLWHRGATSPSPHFAIQKRCTSSPSLPRFHLPKPTPLKFHHRCLPPLDRPTSTALRPYKRRNETTPIIHRTHPGSNLSSSRPEPSPHRSTTDRLC
jgi:hypothetical protein